MLNPYRKITDSLSKSESKKCEKCDSNRVGQGHITKHVEGLLKKDRNPKTDYGYRNSLAVTKGLHRKINEGKEPCPLCISEYETIIEQVILSFTTSQ